MTPGQPTDLPFPLKGINVSTEFELQPRETTPEGENVRALDPLLERHRGGSRRGLIQYIPERVGGLDSVIQHLNYIVDPTTAALLTSFTDEFGVSGGDGTGEGIPDPSTNNAAGGVTDPDDNPEVRNPGREVPEGGSGVQPNRRVPAPDDDPSSVTVVLESAFHVSGLPDTSSYHASHAFPAEVEAGDLLAVLIWSADIPYITGDVYQSPAISNFEDTLGLTWTLQDSYFATQPPIPPVGSSFQWGRAWLYTAKAGLGGNCTFSWDFAYNHGTEGPLYHALCYAIRGLPSSTPVEVGEVYLAERTANELKMPSAVTPDNNSNILVVAGTAIGAVTSGTTTAICVVPDEATMELVGYPTSASILDLIYSKQDLSVAVPVTAEIDLADETGGSRAFALSVLLCRKN